MENTVFQKKICLLGSFAVGKTSLVHRFVYNLFEEKYLSTIGVTISRKQVQVAENTVMSMVIWDLAGSDEFNGKQASYLQGTAGALLVCDVTRENTFESIQIYRAKLEKISPGADVVVIGNKLDIAVSLKDAEENMARLAGEINAPYFLTSAKTGTNVEEAFFVLARKFFTSSK